MRQDLASIQRGFHTTQIEEKSKGNISTMVRITVDASHIAEGNKKTGDQQIDQNP